MTRTATDRIVTNLRSSVNVRKDYVAYVAENSVTRDNLAEHCKALAALAFPNDNGAQRIDGKRTKYGNAVQLAGYHFRAILDSEESDEETKTVNLLTREGCKADLDAVVAAWHAAQK